jgi:hypothetical protein
MNYNFDFERIWEDKRRMGERLAAAPIAEKLRMLHAMRERALALRNARLTERSVAREEPPLKKAEG